MQERRASADRRVEPRSQTAGRLSWRCGGARRAFIGYVSDISRSGISFIAGAPATPQAGELIELCGADGLKKCWKVVRVSAYDASSSVIACRRWPTTPAPQTSLPQ